MPYANNKGADQTEHPRSLISTFIVCCLDTVMSVKIDLEGSGCGLSQVGSSRVTIFAGVNAICQESDSFHVRLVINYWS